MGRRELAAGLGAAMSGIGQGLMTMGKVKSEEDMATVAQDLQRRTIEVQESRVDIEKKSAAFNKAFQTTKHAQDSIFQAEQLVLARMRINQGDKLISAQSQHLMQQTENLNPENARAAKMFDHQLATDATTLGHHLRVIEILKTAHPAFQRVYLENFMKYNIGLEDSMEKFQGIFDKITSDNEDEASLYIQSALNQANAAVGSVNSSLSGLSRTQQGPTQSPQLQPFGLGNTTIAPDRQGVTAGGIEVDVPTPASSSSANPSIDEQMEGLVESLKNVPDDATIDQALAQYRKLHPEFSEADARRVKLRIGTAKTNERIEDFIPKFDAPQANPRSARLIAGGGS